MVGLLSFVVIISREILIYSNGLMYIKKNALGPTNNSEHSDFIGNLPLKMS